MLQDNFDTGMVMGTWDGDESCDIVSLYILDQPRDDATGAETTARNTQKMRQKIIDVMKKLVLNLSLGQLQTHIHMTNLIHVCHI